MRLLKPVIVIFLLMVFSPKAFASNPRVNVPGDLIRNGKNYMKLKKFEKAIVEFEMAHRYSPHREDIAEYLQEACMALAWQYAEEKSWELAIQYARQAYEVNPHNEKIQGILSAYYSNFAYAAYQEKKLDIAESRFKEALFFNDNNWNAYVGLGNLEYDSAKFDDAAVHWKKALSINPNLPETRKRLESCTQTSVLENTLASLQLGNFSIKYEGIENKDIAVQVARILGKAYNDVGASLQCYPKAYIPVILYSSEQYGKLINESEEKGRPHDDVIRIRIGEIKDNANLEEYLYDKYKQALLYKKEKK